jgi:hypothetical protein
MEVPPAVPEFITQWIWCPDGFGPAPPAPWACHRSRLLVAPDATAVPAGLKVAHASARRAVDLEILPADPRPPRPKGRSHRKAARTRRRTYVACLNHAHGRGDRGDRQPPPESRKYQLVTAVAYYAGLRPSEVVMPRPRALTPWM